MDKATIRIRTIDIDNIVDIENLLDTEGVDYSIDVNNRISLPSDDLEKVENMLDKAYVQYDEV